jgi:parvulin-like peptidyl-prolyl isomerase
MSRTLYAGLLFVAVTSAGCREAFVAHVDTVARAGDAELTVTQMSEILSSVPEGQITRGAVDQLARIWVDYSLLAQHLARGDSLLDSSVVLGTMWPDVQEVVADSFRTLRVADLLPVDSAAVDSAYRAGELRYIAHVLRRFPPDATTEQKEQKKREAERIRDRLMRGGTWDEANRQNEDPGAAANAGGLGVISRGQMVPRFENVAYALGPGDLSEVTETQFGYHIVFRPELEDVREQFAAAVTGAIVNRVDSMYLDDLLERRQIEVASTTAATVREVAAAPQRYRSSRKALGTFDTGRFTAADFVRWFRVLPPQMQQQVNVAPDEQIDFLVRQLIQQELLRKEAESTGVRLSEHSFNLLKQRYAADLDLLKQAINISAESLAVAGIVPEEREWLGQVRVNNYMAAAVRNEGRFVVVKPFLGDWLREGVDWEVRSAGIERVLERRRFFPAAGEATTTPPSEDQRDETIRPQ